MTFEPALPDVIRASSGVLWVALGIALLARRGQAPTARWLGVFFVLTAPDFVGTNIAQMFQPPSPVFIARFDQAAAIANVAAGCALLMVLVHEARVARRSARRALVLGLASGALAIAFLVEQHARAGIALPPRAWRNVGEFFAYSLLAALGAHFATRSAAAPGARERAFVWIAAALPLLPIEFANDIVGEATGLSWEVLASGLALLTPTLVAVVAIIRERPTLGARAPVLGFTILGIGAVALVAGAIAKDELGIRGVARLIAFGFVVTAALELSWSGRGMGSARSRTGIAAAVALPMLLIVAQIAQNFLEAQYGLLMGGIVAGAFLFAASPIQRALEGRREARALQPDAAREDAYRAAVRMALRDRRITREEELHLHRVAEHMGIATGRAHELLIEVEREQEPEDPPR